MGARAMGLIPFCYRPPELDDLHHRYRYSAHEVEQRRRVLRFSWVVSVGKTACGFRSFFFHLAFHQSTDWVSLRPGQGPRESRYLTQLILGYPQTTASTRATHSNLSYRVVVKSRSSEGGTSLLQSTEHSRRLPASQPDTRRTTM